MRSSRIPLTLVIGLTAALSGCATGPESRVEVTGTAIAPSGPPITATSTPPTRAAVTSTAMPEPVVTVGSTEPPTTPRPTPVLHPDAFDAIIFGASSSGCQLPCWHGLRPVVSGRDDVIRVLDDVFNFGGSFHTHLGLWGNAPTGYEAVGYEWRIWDMSEPPYPIGDFAVYGLVNSATSKMERLTFIFGTRFTEFRPDIEPQRFILEFGVPEVWLVSVERGGQGEGFEIVVRSLMVFENGVSVEHIAHLPLDLVDTPDGLREEAVFWCLGDYVDGDVYLGEPFQGEESLTPLQEWAFSYQHDKAPIEDVLSISIADIVQQVHYEENVCLQVNADYD